MKKFLLVAGLVLLSGVLFVQTATSSFSHSLNMETDVEKYKAADLKVTGLRSRMVMNHALNLTKRGNLSPAKAARYYAYVASIFYDVLKETGEREQAVLATAQIFYILSPDFNRLTDGFLASLNLLDKTPSPQTQKIITEYKNRLEEEGTSPSQWRPWILEGKEYNIPPLPPVGSTADKAELIKISYATLKRSEKDLDNIYFWQGVGQVKGLKGDEPSPPGIWQNIFFIEEGQEIEDEEKYAEIQKILAQVLADTYILAWGLKEQYPTLRPPGRIDNLDAAVEPPSYSGYPSHYASSAEVASSVLSFLFPEKEAFWRQVGEDSTYSRVLAGVNFDIDTKAGKLLGEYIANDILNKLYPEEYKPKPVTIPSQPSVFELASFFIVQNLESAKISLRKAVKEALSQKPTSSFVEVTQSAGIAKAKAEGGVSWADYDSDGFLDLVVTGNGVTLYKNNGDETFTDVTGEARLGDICCKTQSAIFGDYDNDDYLDLYVVNFGSYEVRNGPEGKDRLFRNNGDGTFTDVTEEAGISCLGHGEGAAWGDYNKDGFLDIFVANWGMHDILNSIHHWEEQCFYRNNGDGTFTDVTKELGFDQMSEVNSPSREYPGEAIVRFPFPFQPYWFDYNNDSWLDLFLANDHAASNLYKNNGDGTFTDMTEEAGLNRLGSGMGVSIADFNGDGFFDIYVTNDAPNYLWKNNGDGTFSEVAQEVGVDDPLTGWGANFFDFDNDGDLDLFLTNGLVDEEIQETLRVKELAKRNTNVFFENLKGEYREITDKTGFNQNDLAIKRGSAVADFNNDGFPDIAIAPNVDQIEPSVVYYTHPRLYKNKGNQNNWLKIQLNGTKSNKMAVGASVKVTAGRSSQAKLVAAGSSFDSQDSPLLTFGLGKVKKADKIEVYWPSGQKQVLTNIPVNQEIVIREE